MGKRRSILTGIIAASLILVSIMGCGAALGGQDSMSAPENLSYPREASPVEKVVVMEAEAPAMYDEDSALGATGTIGNAYAAERLIIRTGNISMEVEDTLATQETIEGMVKAMAADGAFVVSSEEHGAREGNQPYISMSIRVPATGFDEIMGRLADLAVNVNSRNESAQDVTEEYVDLEARLESLEAARQRLLEIMEEARSTKDLLEAEQQLTQREAEIESIKGRMQYLEQSAALSSIWIELQPHILSQPVSDEWKPFETVRRAVEALVNGLQGFANFLIFFGIAILPWLLLLGLVIFLIVRFIRWRRRARKAKRAARSQDAEQAAPAGEEQGPGPVGESPDEE